MELIDIKNLIQRILDKNHNVLEKRRINEYDNRLNFACPICGDSKKFDNRKRGNLYTNSMMYICFNCEDMREPISILKFLEKFDVKLNLEDRIQLYEYIDNNIKYSNNDDLVLTNLDKLIPLKDLISFFETKEVNKITNFRPVEKNSAVYQYLKLHRYITNFNNIYQAEYYITPKWKQPVMIFMNMHGDKIIGMQIRNIETEKVKRFFKIYDFKELYNYLHPNVLDDIESISYNKLSHFFNILNVNFEDKVTIFEGFLDSKFFPNSLGAIGLNSIEDFRFILNIDDVDVQFFLDNDSYGFKDSLQWLDKGYKVFLWKKLFDDIIKNKKDKYEAIRLLNNNVKDLNDLVKFSKNIDVYNTFKLQNYFSIDKFDKKYL